MNFIFSTLIVYCSNYDWKAKAKIIESYSIIFGEG